MILIFEAACFLMERGLSKVDKAEDTLYRNLVW